MGHEIEISEVGWKDIKRLFKKVHFNPNTWCLEWNKPIPGGHGYPYFYFKKRWVRASRFAWLAEFGELSSGLCVLHKCDNKTCINTDHLFLGTQKDNVADMMRKGRGGYITPQIYGSDRWNSKINEEQALAIRTSRESQGKLAIQYGITQSTISNIKRGKTWKHV